MLRNGDPHTIDFRVDPSKTPWDLTVQLSPIEIELAWLTPLFPPPWGIPRVDGKARIQKADFTGPLGDWKRWTAAVQAQIEAPKVDLNVIERTLHGVTSNLDFTVTGDRWIGTASLSVDEAATAAVEGGFRGLRSEKLAFEYSMVDGSAEVSGLWTASDIWGSAYRGNLLLSSGKGYRVEADTENLNWKQLPYSLDGNWRAKIVIEDESLGGSSPKFQATLQGNRFRLGAVDLSEHPVELVFGGKVTRLVGGTEFDRVGLTWGKALSLDMKGTVWDGSELSAQEAVLSGDLAALANLVPNVRISPWVDRYLNPKGWRIRGGVRVKTSPSLEVEIQQGRIDSGRGIEGPIGFRYSQSNRTWSLQAPTISLNLAELVREMKIAGLEIQGSVAVRADFSGQVPTGSRPGAAWIGRAFFDGEVRDCKGRVSRNHRDGRFDQYLFEWVGAGGRISLDWNSNAKILQSNLSLQNLIWYTRPAEVERMYPRSLEAGRTHLAIQVQESGPQQYEIRQGTLSLGPVDPIQISATGTIGRTGDRWTPNLRFRLQGNRSPTTPVFRGVTLAGSGIMQGTIRGNPQGNWIFNGKANLDGIDFVHVIAPVNLTGLRGTFEVKNFALDEYMLESRWNARPHRGVSEITDPQIVQKAFEISRGTSPNVVMSRMEVGTNRFRNVALRVVREGEFLYMNTASGEFEEGGFPVRMTGYFFFHPRDGVAYRLAGYTERAPLGVAIPLVGNVGLDRQAVEVKFLIAQDLYQEEVQTRYINLGIPIDGLKDIPGFGPALFGWTPDSLRSREVIARKVGDGEWTILNPITLNDAIGIPDFILRDVPGRAIGQTRDMGASFLDGFGEGVRDIIEGQPK